MHTMKTAISLDDSLMTEADRAAREIGVSRSRLFSLALEEYLRKREHDRILAQLNLVYGSESDAGEKRVPARLKTKFRSTIKERW
jgi:metal-responsive CopG/Arc/MetJ family transcriptional regulator